MSKHWYRNDELDRNKLLSDDDVIPAGYSRKRQIASQNKLNIEFIYNH